MRILLRYKGIEFEQMSPPGGYGSVAYKKVVPAGTIPAIVHEGFVLADSEAIAEYVEEVWPDKPLLPPDAQSRARARELSRFHDTRLEPEIRSLFGQIAPSGRDEVFVRAKADMINVRLQQLAELLAGFDLANRDLCLGDCGFPVSFEWLDAFFPAIGPTLTWPEKIIDYRTRLRAIPEVALELEAYEPAVNDWTQAKLSS